ncbi:MAG: NAD(P)H-dependent oxidoreductase [Chthoniobacterales bacterium]
MSAITHFDLLEQLRWRYATKQFDASKKIPAELWKALKQVLVLSPSSFGLQPWKFFLIENPDVRRELRAVSWNQSQITDASHLVVFTVKHPLTPEDVKDHITNTSATTGAPAERLAGLEKATNDFIAQFADANERRAWASRQVYIALGNFLTSAALLGLDTCPIEGLEPTSYDKILGLGEDNGYFTLAVCAVGYRSPEDKSAQAPKVRFPHTRVFQTI